MVWVRRLRNGSAPCTMPMQKSYTWEARCQLAREEERGRVAGARTGYAGGLNRTGVHTFSQSMYLFTFFFRCSQNVYGAATEKTGRCKPGYMEMKLHIDSQGLSALGQDSWYG